MKRKLLVFVIACLLFGMFGCAAEQDVLHMGVNAVITGVDLEAQTVIVKDPGEEGFFGEGCTLVWEADAFELIYCDFESGDVREILLSDLEIGDEITVTASESELSGAESGTVKIQQIQLMTQRME